MAGASDNVTVKDKVNGDLWLVTKLLGNLALLDKFYAITISNKDGLIVYANENFYTMTGLVPREILNKKLKLHDPRTSYLNALNRKIMQDEMWHGEIQNQHKNGQKFWVDALIIPLRQLGHDEDGFLSISTRITDLKSLIDELSSEIYEKQSELNSAYTKLSSARKTLSLGMLASSIVHEINNPVSVIQSNIQFIRDIFRSTALRLGSPGMVHEASDLVVEIEHALERIQRITSQLKHYSHFREEDKAYFSLGECIERAIRQTGHMTDRPGIVLYLGSDIAVHGYEYLVEVVFINLLTNAIQAMKNRLGQITISGGPAGNAKYVRIEVKDTGIGIPEQDIKFVFDPFYVVDRPERGVGLGLTVCADIIDQHKGMINCYSVEGVGSEFVVYLPVDRPDCQSGATGSMFDI